MYRVLWAKTGKQIKLLGEKSRKFLLCWFSRWSSALLNDLKKLKKTECKNDSYLGGRVSPSVHGFFCGCMESRTDHPFRLDTWAALYDAVDHLKLINQYISYYFTHFLPLVCSLSSLFYYLHSSPALFSPHFSPSPPPLCFL